MSGEQNNNRRNSVDRKIEYNRLLNDLEELKESEDLGPFTSQQLTNIFQEVAKIDDECSFEDRVKHSDELCLEANVLTSSSALLSDCVQNIAISSSTYEPNDFASKIIDEIKDSYTNTDVNWLKLLNDARGIVHELPNYSSLYGSFDPTVVPEPKQKLDRTKRVPEAVAEKKHMQLVKNVDKEDESVEDTINFLAHILQIEYEKNDCNPINYFNFIIDSNDFTSTVENMFYTSFLIRDGKAKLDIENDNVATLKPMRKRNLKEFRSSGGVNHQMITSMTMEDWEIFKSNRGFIEIHKEMMKIKS